MQPWALGLTLLAFSPADAPSEPGFEVVATECPSVDPARLAQLLALELSLVVDERGSSGRRYRVELRCDAQATMIAVEDPLTDKRLERRLPPLAADDPDPARTVAIGATQLFAASWVEFEVPPPPEHPPLPAAPHEQALAAELLDARGHAAPRVTPPRPGLEHGLVLHLGQRARKLGEAVRMTEVSLGYVPRVRLGSARRVTLGPSFVGDFELGATRRANSRVAALLAGGRAGLDLRLESRQEIALWAGLELGFAWQQLRAQPEPGSELVGGRVRGFGIDPAARVGFVLDTGRVGVALALEGGYLVGGPQGLTPEGSVALRGAWLGGGLELVLDFSSPD